MTVATRGRPIPATTMAQIQRLPLSVRKAARHVNVSPTTVVKYRKKPA